MSEDDPNNHAELVPVEHGLALISLVDNRIVSEMVADSLVLARDSAPVPVDLDALVREAKRLYRSKGDGMTETKTFAPSSYSSGQQRPVTAKRNISVGICYITGQGAAKRLYGSG